ncbi:MAG: NAD-dependent epimerase/dehydratase family protein [Candidatus Erginobacter occultus]|nr:NAD-dependent epimerase/dehydratase family protein [Candidatus Erginobacter occultus]
MSKLRDIPVMITGASGFLGSHLVRRLLREGARVNVLALPDDPRSRLEKLDGKIRVHPVNIRDETILKRVTGDISPRLIFHLAALTSPERSRSRLASVLAVNLGGTVNLLRALDGIKYDKLVCTCTAEAYGKNPPPFREDMALDPPSPYSLSKAAATLACRTWANLSGAPITILRLFLAYGPGQDEDRFIPQLIRAGLTGDPLRMTAGEQTREFTYIDDVIEGLLLAAQRETKPGEVINIGSGREISLRGLVEKVELILGRRVPIHPDTLPYRRNEIWRYVGDHARAASRLGWRPRVPLEEGLARTVEWYRAQLSKERPSSPGGRTA